MPGTFPGTDGQSPVRQASDSSGWVWGWATAEKIRETSGPTNLSVGAIADGKYLRRSGATVVGDDVVSMKESGGTVLSIGAIADLQMLQRSGSSLIGMAPGGHIWGLKLSNNATDATNDIDIAVGEAASDDVSAADRILMGLTSALTKQLDVTWAAGTNAGGRVSGQTLADGTWHVFLFRRSGGAIDVCFSNALSFTTPDSGTHRRRIASILRESAAIAGFIQDGDLFQRKTSIKDVGVSNPGTAAVLRTLSIPADLNVIALVNIAIQMGTSGSGATVYLSDPAVDDGAPSRDNAPLGTVQIDSAAQEHGGGPYPIRTNTSRQIRSRFSHSGASDTMDIATLGWIDRRGRDA